MIGPAPDCMKCIHFDSETLHKNKCKAFPDGIPDEIFFKGADHTKPFPGDNGIRFEPLTPVA